MGLLDIVPAGVVTGKNLLKLFEYGKLQKLYMSYLHYIDRSYVFTFFFLARENSFAIPAINCTSTR